MYMIHKGIERPVVFKGLVGQYIWWLGGAIAGLLLLFAIIYMAGVPLVLCVVIVLFFGIAVFVVTGHLSRRFGEYGWMKHNAAKYIPKHIKGAIFK